MVKRNIIMLIMLMISSCGYSMEGVHKEYFDILLENAERIIVNIQDCKNDLKLLSKAHEKDKELLYQYLLQIRNNKLVEEWDRITKLLVDSSAPVLLNRHTAPRYQTIADFIYKNIPDRTQNK